MSASDKKKLRKEEKQEKLTLRQQAEQKEAKKTKLISGVFTAVICIVLVLGIGLLGYQWYQNSGIYERNTTAVVIGDHELNIAELNYYYMDILNELSQSWYDMYLLQMEEGLDTSVALDKQKYHDEDRTWADYFIDEAIKEASAILSLADTAKSEGFSLSEAEKKQLDKTMKTLEEETMVESGYTDLDDFLRAVYGNGADADSYRSYLETKTLAQSYATFYSSSLTYTDDEIAAKEAEVGSYSSFSYTAFELSIDSFLEHEENEEGEEEHNHSDEEKAAALKQAEQIAQDLVASGATTKEELDKAIAKHPYYNTTSEGDVEGEPTEETDEEATESTEAATEPTEAATEPTEGVLDGGADITVDAETEEETEPTEGVLDGGADITVDAETEEETEEETGNPNAPTSYAYDDYLYSVIDPAIGEWLLAEGRKAGDIGMVPSYALDDEGEPTEEVVGYTVVIFGSEDIQDQKTVSTRHILVRFEGGTYNEDTATTTYSDKEKKAAFNKADKILNQWLDGEKTEESFAALAKKYTEDSNAAIGGLYDSVYEGWATEEAFDNWCFDDSRKAGDCEIVEASYGYHILYYVGENDTDYRYHLIANDLRTAEAEEWYESHEEAYFSKAVKKEIGALRTDIIFASSK